MPYLFHHVICMIACLDEFTLSDSSPVIRHIFSFRLRKRLASLISLLNQGTRGRTVIVFF